MSDRLLAAARAGERVHDDTLANLVDEAEGWEKDVQDRIKNGSYGYDGGEEQWNDDHAQWATNHGIVTALRELQRLRAAIEAEAWSTDPPTEEGWCWAWAPDCREPIREYWTAGALADARRHPVPGRHWRPSPVPEPPAWPTGQDDTPPPRPAHGCMEFSATMGLDGIYRLKCAECGRVHEARLQPSPVTADEDTADFTPNLKG